jgi:hypothetical protein
LRGSAIGGSLGVVHVNGPVIHHFEQAFHPQRARHAEGPARVLSRRALGGEQMELDARADEPHVGARVRFPQDHKGLWAMLREIGLDRVKGLLAEPLAGEGFPAAGGDLPGLAWTLRSSLKATRSLARRA